MGKAKKTDANLECRFWADIPRYHNPLQYPEHTPYEPSNTDRIAKKKATREELMVIELTRT